MKRTKQILSVFLSVCIIISCMVGMNVTVSAEEADTKTVDINKLNADDIIDASNYDVTVNGDFYYRCAEHESDSSEDYEKTTSGITLPQGYKYIVIECAWASIDDDPEKYWWFTYNVVSDAPTPAPTEEIVEWYIGDKINLMGKWFVPDDSDEYKDYIYYGTSTEFTVPEPEYDDDYGQWYFGDIKVLLYEVVESLEEFWMTIPSDKTSSVVPTGFKVKSGTGTEDDPYMFELIYTEKPGDIHRIAMKNGGKAYVNDAEVTSAAVGTDVTIVAPDASAGTEFNGWTSTPSVTFADASNATTTFRMPICAVTIIPTYKDASPAPTNTLTWYVGDSFNLNGKWINYDNTDAISKVHCTDQTTIVPSPVYDSINFKQWLFKSFVFSDIDIYGDIEDYYDGIFTLYFSPPTGKPSSYIPTGFKVESGTGTKEDPYKFELVYTVKPAYTITINNGGKAYVNDTEVTSATAGTVVTIKAKSSVSTPARFNGWTTTTEGVEFADADSVETTFVMPISDVTITASFEGVTPYIPSYSPSNTSTTTTTTANAPAETMTFEGEETISHTNLLSWSSVSGASSYLISVKTDGKFVPLATTTKTNIDVVHAYNGKYYVSEGGRYTAYTYKDGKFVKGGTITAAQADKLVKANNVTETYMLQYTKNGKLSSEKSALTVSVKVYYKPAVKASSKDGKVVLKWKKVVGAEKYRIYKYTNNKLTKIADTDANAVRINKVTAGKTYKYAVKAYVDGKWTKVTSKDIVSVKVK